MMEGWKEVKIKDVSKIIGGYAFKSKDFSTDGQVPIIKIKSLKDRNLVIEEGDFIDQSFLELDEKFHIKFNDILIALTGSHITLPSSAVGRVAKSRFHQTLLLNQRVGKFVVDSNVCNHDFLYYTLITNYFFQSVGLKAKGAANQANISGGDIGNIKINLPSLPIQRKIASILSAYDDLIENNLKRIKLLEEKAQLTYEEWFVRLKFPGYETTPINVKTGLPEGWKKGKLLELIGYQSGFAYKSAKFTEEGMPVIKIKNIDNNTIDISNTNFIDKEYALQTEKYKLNEGDLLIAMTGATVGKVGIVPITKVPCYLNQRVGRFLKIGEVDNTSFINNFFSIGGGLNHVLNIAGGAAQPNISAKQILSIDSIIPSSKILERFSNMAISSTEERLNLQKQNELLKEARDLLLPRLMTGMIDVEQLNLETLQPTTI